MIKFLAIILLLVILGCFIWIIQIWRHYRMIPLIPTAYLIYLILGYFVNRELSIIFYSAFMVVLFATIFCDYFGIDGSEPILDRMFGYKKLD